MKTVLFLFLLLLVIGVGGKFAVDYINTNGFPSFGKQTTVKVDGKVLSAKVARTPEEKQVGLSNSTSLNANSGMLFPFESADYHTFWMKNMKFPIDIIFINDGTVVTLYENVQPPSSSEENPPLYQPTEPADMVLELNAGEARKLNIQKDTKIEIENL